MRISIKHQYTLLQTLYWMGSSISIGFAAVFLQHKGLSNSLVGLAIGGAAFLAIPFQPLLADFIEKNAWFTLRRTILLLLCLTGTAFLFLSVVLLPKAVLVVMYLLFNTLYNAAIPLITSLGMEYLNEGQALNFSVSRGAGSLSYAASAMILGLLLERYAADIITWLFLTEEILLFMLVFWLKEPKNGKTVRQTDGSSAILDILKKNSALPYFIAGFCLCYLANCVTGTYMVNIVKNAGGTETSLGLCGFLSAASAMPAMLLCPWMLQRISCRRLMQISSFFHVCKLTILFLAPSLPFVYAGFLLQSLSFGLYTPASVYLVNQEIPAKDRLKGQTLFSVATSGLGGGIGNLTGGFMQDTLGLKTTLGICALLASAGFLITLRVKIKSWNSK